MSDTRNKEGTENMTEKIAAYKGFDKDFKCREFQFELGKSYDHAGEVKACSSGFHGCTNPLDVFAYYAPGESRFASVELSGELSRHNGDSKIAAARITITAELSLPDVIAKAIACVTALCAPATSNHATGDRSASSATGDRSASSATGDRSASSATGDSSASSATGDRSASSATGYRSASSATGYSSASSATGYSSASSATGDSSASITTGSYSSSEITPHPEGAPLHAVALACGYGSKARAPLGSAIILVHRNAGDGSIIKLVGGKTGEAGVKPDTWYTLDEGGQMVEAA